MKTIVKVIAGAIGLGILLAAGKSKEELEAAKAEAADALTPSQTPGTPNATPVTQPNVAPQPVKTITPSAAKGPKAQPVKGPKTQPSVIDIKPDTNISESDRRDLAFLNNEETAFKEERDITDKVLDADDAVIIEAIKLNDELNHSFFGDDDKQAKLDGLLKAQLTKEKRKELVQRLTDIDDAIEVIEAKKKAIVFGK